MNRALVAFGILTLMVGVGIGYLMCTHPEGMNPAWPIEMAALAPAVFVFGGLHIIAAGLGQPRLSSAMLVAIVLCLWAIVNWAAFFTPHIECVATVSFLGAEIVDWHPSELQCRNSLRVIIAVLDTLVVMVVGAFAWQRRRAPGPE